MRKVILKAPGCPGDACVLSGVLRELQARWPGRFQTGLDRVSPIFEHSPWVANLDPSDPAVRRFCYSGLPDFRACAASGKHFTEHYAASIGQKLGVEIKVENVRGDIHLSDDEKAGLPPTWGITRSYWVVVTSPGAARASKLWGRHNYQAVVDALAGKVQFVQAGHREDWHPPLRGVVNLVGKTSLRDLCRLVYHADGVLCPITSAMHLAAGLPDKPGHTSPRPCVVLAGGREAPAWLQYPGHTILHTIGKLDCCKTPCGKLIIGPGDCENAVSQAHGDPARLCACFDMIRPADVIEAVVRSMRPALQQQPPAAVMHRILGRTRALLQRLPAGLVVGAEIGVADGVMSGQLLSGRRDMELVMVDNWTASAPDSEYRRVRDGYGVRDQARQDAAFKNALANTEFAAGRRRIVRGDSAEAAQQFRDGSLDFVFIDAEHTYQGCKDDIEAWLPKLKPGGLVSGHDYGRNHSSTVGVKRAVDELAKALGAKLEADADFTWFIRLPPFAPFSAPAVTPQN